MRLVILSLSFALLVGPSAASGSQKTKLRVGHFPNVTHAQGVIAHGPSRAGPAGNGWFEERLGSNVELEWFVYSGSCS